MERPRAAPGFLDGHGPVVLDIGWEGTIARRAGARRPRSLSPPLGMVTTSVMIGLGGRLGRTRADGRRGPAPRPRRRPSRAQYRAWPNEGELPRERPELPRRPGHAPALDRRARGHRSRLRGAVHPQRDPRGHERRYGVARAASAVSLRPVGDPGTRSRRLHPGASRRADRAPLALAAHSPMSPSRMSIASGGRWVGWARWGSTVSSDHRGPGGTLARAGTIWPSPTPPTSCISTRRVGLMVLSPSRPDEFCAELRRRIPSADPA